ncbi:MAG: LCP family protein [Candidatus Limnocylindrales bacterium]
MSFLWPGLGQWYTGSTRNAVLFALPVLAVVLVLALQLRDGLTTLALSLFNPSTALTVLALIGLLGVWRLISMGDAMVTAGRGRTWRRSGTLATFAGLALVVVVVHAAAASFAWSAYQAGSEIFVGEPGPDNTPQPGATTAPGESAPSPAPQPTRATADSRITVLLTGIDSSETRDQALTDTMLVVSVDPTDGQVTMVSFPRDIAQFKLSDGRTFTGKLNSLMNYADRNPREFPDGGKLTLTREVGHLLGIPIHYYAAVDLEGFAHLIDRVGGVTINNGTAIDDPGYGGWTDGRPVGFRLSKGRHTLDGQEALAFVRSRRTTSDFSRARRQQQLIIALQRELTDPSKLPSLPGILADASDTVTTNFPVDGLGEMVDLATRVDDSTIKRVVLNAPYSNRPPLSTTGGIYILELDMDRLEALSVELFGDDSRYATATTP